MSRWIKVHVAVLLAMACVVSVRVNAQADAPGSAGPGSRSLLSNSHFVKPNAAGDWPADWPKAKGVTWEREGKARFLRFKQYSPDTYINLYRAIPVPHPAPATMTLHLTLRYAGVEHGEHNWNDARVIAHFKDKDGHILQPDPNPPHYLGSSGGWRDVYRVVKVPKGAVKLEVIPCLFQVKAGTFDIATFEILSGTHKPHKQKNTTPGSAAALPGLPGAGDFPPVAAKDMPPMLHVSGNQIVDPKGKAVWLQGVNSPSLCWSSRGDHLFAANKAAMDWGANVIRLPLNPALWFGKGKGQHDGGKSYRHLVDEVVRQCAARHVYVVLDLHWSTAGSWENQPSEYDMPDKFSEAFWREVAALYANNPDVLFDLYNEPKDVTWDVWENGGLIQEKNGLQYTTCGMQALIKLVRDTGAKNIVIIGGLDWAYDLSGVLHGYDLHDPSGNGIVYSSHIYEWKKDWQGCVLDVAAKYPVFLGEVGTDPRHLIIHKKDGPEGSYTWAPDMIGMIQKHHLSWTAWSMHIDATPRLISDWNFTPTPFWGAFVRAALAGARFDCTHLR